MEQLVAGARSLGLPLTAKQLGMFQVLYRELIEWNQRFNLTAITEYEQVQIRHFLDSLSCLLSFRHHLYGRGGSPLRCIDVGSGAGFPGLPLKICCPGIHMVLLEATGKKVQFLDHVISHLDLKDVIALKGRAEEAAHDPVHRERYDLVFARAVAKLPVLAEYALPFCRLGGSIVAQKGPSAQEEIHAAEYAISVLGGRLQQVMPVELLGLAEERNLIVIEKAAGTPVQYPRRAGVPSKRPLGHRRMRDASTHRTPREED